jgi:ADP-heptose:LPS heptosyltransferase
MKILVLSLLRIGDIVISAPVLRGLRERHPDAEIHLLLNSQFHQVGSLLPYIDRVIPFERDRLQKGLGDGKVAIFDSYDRLTEIVDQLNFESYDWTINLTHNRLSGWLMNLINAKERSGLCFDHQGRATFGSSWFRYLNDQVDSDGDEVFHYSDVFRFALGLADETSSHSQKSGMIETVKGRTEAEEFLDRMYQGASARKELIAVQVLTSDSKKDWGFDRFQQALGHFARQHPNAGFAVLGAPFEREILAPFVQRLLATGVNAHLAILSFEGAFSLLRKARLLLTGDTSVKHLACAARTPIVEISLGSSDLYRTGAYMHDAVIIQSRETCAPCIHSRPCHRETHACGQRVSPELVSLIACEIFSGRSFQLKTIAEEFKKEAEIYRVDTRSAGFWAAHSVLEPFSEVNVGRWIDRVCRKIWLESSLRGRSGDAVGTEILKLSRLLRVIHPDVSEIEWRHLYSDFERQALSVEGRINSFKVGLSYLCGCYEDPRKMRDFVRSLISFREKIRHAPLLRSYKVALDELIEDDISPAFTRFKRMSDLVTEIEKRTAIHLRLIRGLNQSDESGIGSSKGPEKV